MKRATLAITVLALLLVATSGLLVYQHIEAGAQKQGNGAAPTLAQLCERHGLNTDKCPRHHNYVEVYDKLFPAVRDSTRRLLEIGVLEGDSMRLWEAYFPAAKIFGVDIEPKPRVNTERIRTTVADQGRRKDLQLVLERFGGDYDIIIDDGGHTMTQQQLSFATLFPALNAGGVYIIEDVGTSFPQFYPGYGVEKDGSNSTYTMIDGFVRTGKVRSKYMTDAESAYLSAHISHCLYFVRSTQKVRSDFFACWKK